MSSIDKNKLNETGDGFCLANWTKSVISLPSGVSLDCGIHAPYKLSKEEILETNISLFNPWQRKLIRKNMLENVCPSQCQYCKDVEDLTTCKSERIIRSSKSWSESEHDIIKISNWNDNFLPKYLEISLSNVCNMKCSYCSIDSSSSWIDEVINLGPFFDDDSYNSIDSMLEVNTTPDNDKTTNAYMQSFWNLWPTVYQNLKVLHLSGGEPLLHEDSFTIFDYILNHETPNTDLSLYISSNLSVSGTQVTLLADKLETMINQNKIKEVIIRGSVDTWGNHAEYARFGLDNQLFWNNINYLLNRIPKLSITIDSMYNIFSVINFSQLLTKIYDTNQLYDNGLRYLGKPITIQISYLDFPYFLNVKILPNVFKETIYQSLLDLPNNIKNSFSSEEKDGLKLVYDWSNLPLLEENRTLYENRFVKFVDQHDIRRGTNFLLTFPQLETFYNSIKNR